MRTEADEKERCPMRYGFFDDTRREYVVDRVDCPWPLTNYLGTQRMGAVLSHQAGGYCWLDTPEYGRITRFRPNSVPVDGPGHWVYLRDEESGAYWSLSWQPTAADVSAYTCRHGLSYSVFECALRGIRASQTLLIPREADPQTDPVEVFDIRLKNESGRPRRLSVIGYVEFSFHHISFDQQNFQMSLYCAGSRYEEGAVLCDLKYEEGETHFFASDQAPADFDGTRDAFLGPNRSERNPLGVEKGVLSGRVENGGNPVGALRRSLTLAPGEEARLFFYLGRGGPEAADAARKKYDAAGVDRAMEELRAFWEEKLSVLRVHTPHENMNRSLNIWNLYQAEINVLFSRFSSFIEVGGRTGLGYRDTAQDAMCLPHADPEKCRWRLEQLLHGQVSAGYGLHLFDPAWFEPHPPQDRKSPTVVPEMTQARIHGLDDACSDDALWLIPAVVEYLRETGDLSFAHRVIPFADGGEATVWEHLRRSLDFSFGQLGVHGITKGLRADWNDCLNLGGGESAMVAFLLLWAAEHFSDAARALGFPEEGARYAARAEALKETCHRVLWDGEWYLRGFTADGRPIGSHRDPEGKIHLESAAWSVISGAADKAQAESTLDAVEKWLLTPYGLLLNAPSYTRRDDGVGFITRVYPGVKENGSIFSHPNPWAWVAESLLGRGTRAMKAYDALLPENQNDRMEIRQAEPYAYCQFIMGPDHSAFGRARHPFMTGSAGWAYYAATRYLLGVRPGFDRLVLDPCIPARWDGFSLERRWRGADYRITVRNPAHVEKGIRSLRVDGTPTDRIPVFSSGLHTVEAEMGS